MRKFHVGQLGASCSLIAMMVAATAARAEADAQQATIVGGIESVVVTARKVEENAQSVPLSLTVLSASDIQARGITGVADLQKSTPGFRVGDSTYDPLSMKLGIRGQQQTDNLLQQDPPASVYVDGVLQPGVVGGRVTNPFDLERIEVLKGPQGTLYGRNTPAGAVNLITKLPGDTFGGNLAAGFGNYSEYDFAGDVNVPVTPGKLAFRASAEYQNRGGFGKNTTTGKDVGDLDEGSGRIAVKFEATDALEIILRGDYSEATSGGTLVHGQYSQPGAAGTLAQFETILEKGLGAFTAANLAQALVILNTPADPNNPYSYASALDTHANVKSYGASLTGAYDFGDNLVLKSITAYRGVQRHTIGDGDGTSIGLLDQPATKTLQNQLTQELQLTGQAFADRFKYTLGAFYYTTRGQDFSVGGGLKLLNPNYPSIDNGVLRDDSEAVYGQGTYAITDNVNFTGGLRYTHEKKALESHNSNKNACLVPGVTAGQPCIGFFPETYNNVSYTASVDWKVQEGVLLYVKNARGFRAGGINSRGGAPAPFGPEKDMDYEVGVKSDWLDRRFRFNADYYHTDITGGQVSVVIPVPGGGATAGVQNAAKVRINGFEAEAIVVPIDNLTLTGTVTYTKPKYVQYVSGTTDLSAQSLPVARWLYSLAADYVIPTDIGDLTTSVTWYHQSTLNVFPNFGNTIVEGFTTQSPYGLFDAKMKLNIKSLDLDIVGYGKNLGNKLYITNGFSVASFGSATTFYGAPRTYGMQVIKHF